MGFFKNLFKIAVHPITAIVIRSLDEAIAAVDTVVRALADKTLTDAERREIAAKLNALAKSILGV